jgi:hypothetical protein
MTNQLRDCLEGINVGRVRVAFLSDGRERNPKEQEAVVQRVYR